MGTGTAVRDEHEAAALEGQASPYRALYAHWERTQWSALALDLETDTASFSALGEGERAGLVWIFAHRFHAEFNVARLLAPFLLAAPDYEMQLLLATQVADEHRHLQAVLRIYQEVFGLGGGIEAVRELADRNIDPVAETLYGKLEECVAPLGRGADEDLFLRAVVAYHLLGEGVVARTAQNLAGGQYEYFGHFPGLAEGQRLVARDEARHIGIGISYVRRRIERDGEHALSLVGAVIAEFGQLAAELLQTAHEGMGELVRAGYGVEPEGFYSEAMRLLGLRLRSIGYPTDHVPC